MSNPSHPHTVMDQTRSSPAYRSSKNPNGPSPTLPSSQFARPKFLSNSHRNMIPVAIVDVTTGMNTARR